MVSCFLCNSIATLKLPPPSPPPSITRTKPPFPANSVAGINFNFPTKPLLQTLTTALSISLLVSSPSSVAAIDASISPQTLPSSSSYLVSTPEVCEEGKELKEQAYVTAPEVVSNEEIVSEAWEIVNDGFLDAGLHRWTPEAWLKKKEYILSSSIQTRSKAHDIIQRMLASLGDPYTRFLSHEQFAKMARYDMTGIGINLREIPDDSGAAKLKVLGILLDGPAQAAGVRQDDEVISVNGVSVKGKSAFEVSSLLQGPNGTRVTMEVKHGECGPVQSVEVERQLVARTPVFFRLEQTEKGTTSVGYVRLKEFNALARKDLVTAMKRLQGMGASYFVLDLRDNLGGLVQVKRYENADAMYQTENGHKFKLSHTFSILQKCEKFNTTTTSSSSLAFQLDQANLNMTSPSQGCGSSGGSSKRSYKQFSESQSEEVQSPMKPTGSDFSVGHERPFGVKKMADLENPGRKAFRDSKKKKLQFAEILEDSAVSAVREHELKMERLRYRTISKAAAIKKKELEAKQQELEARKQHNALQYLKMLQTAADTPEKKVTYYAQLEKYGQSFNQQMDTERSRFMREEEEEEEEEEED